MRYSPVKAYLDGNRAGGAAAGKAGLPRQPKRSRSAGFSLIEVVVAVAILGIAAGAIFQLLTRSLRNIDRIDYYQNASQLAQNKMNEFLFDDKIYEASQLEGRWNENCWWRAEMEPSEIDDLRLDKTRLSTRLLNIRLTVFYQYGPATRELKLFNIKLVPKPKIGERGYLTGR